jgi:hypothetical protein
MRIRVAAAIVALLAMTEPAAAGVLRGRLELSSSSRRKPPANEVAKPDPRLKDAVVYLERVPEAVERRLTRRWWFQPRPKPPRVRQFGLRFTPRVVAVAAGSEIVFENADRVFHNAFSVSASKRFDLGRYPPGHRDTVTFDRAGVANLHCDVHPEELGFVVVCPNHAFARPDSLGWFELPKLVPGVYLLRAWHPRRGEAKRQVVMPARGDLTVELAL